MKEILRNSLKAPTEVIKEAAEVFLPCTQKSNLTVQQIQYFLSFFLMIAKKSY